MTAETKKTCLNDLNHIQMQLCPFLATPHSNNRLIKNIYTPWHGTELQRTQVALLKTIEISNVSSEIRMQIHSNERIESDLT